MLFRSERLTINMATARAVETWPTFRVLTEADLINEEVEFVKRRRELGFSLDHTSSLLALAETEERTCKEVSEIAEERLDEVRAKIADLQRKEKVLQKFVDGCPRDANSQCPIIATLSNGGLTLS